MDNQPPANPTMRRVLFVCSQNRLRSPTAEQVFADWPGLEVASAGLDATAETPLSGELLEWAEIPRRQAICRLKFSILDDGDRGQC